MRPPIEQIFKGYSIQEIEEILLKSAIETLKKKKNAVIFSNRPKRVINDYQIKM